MNDVVTSLPSRGDPMQHLLVAPSIIRISKILIDGNAAGRIFYVRKNAKQSFLVLQIARYLEYVLKVAEPKTERETFFQFQYL